MRILSPEILYWAQMGFMGRGDQQGLMKGASNPHDPPPDGGPIYKACTVVYMNPNLKFDDLNCAINLPNAIVRTRRTIDFTIELQVVRAGFKLKKKERKREVAVMVSVINGTSYGKKDPSESQHWLQIRQGSVRTAVRGDDTSVCGSGCILGLQIVCRSECSGGATYG
ncbi:mov34 family protein [Populus alba x Populus x berolinensis]|nr:mov34 family protein [Populus alba x Populus x berolinensis]